MPEQKTAVMEAREIFQDQPDLLFDREVNELLDRWQNDKDELFKLREQVRKEATNV